MKLENDIMQPFDVALQLYTYYQADGIFVVRIHVYLDNPVAGVNGQAVWLIDPYGL